MLTDIFLSNNIPSKYVDSSFYEPEYIFDFEECVDRWCCIAELPKSRGILCCFQLLPYLFCSVDSLT